MSLATFFSLLLAMFLSVYCGTSVSESPKCTFTRQNSSVEFYPLSGIPNSQPEGFHAVVKVAVTSDDGGVHVFLSESNDNENSNRGYEFALIPYMGIEIRLRNKTYGTYEVRHSITSVYNSYFVTEYAPNVANIEISISNDGVLKLTDLNVNATIDFMETINFPINFIGFSGHSDLGFQCDYEVFHGNTGEFIQSRCETIFGWHDYSSHPLTTVSTSSPNGYYAKVEISTISDYGSLHIFLSEKKHLLGPNPCYEFVIGDRFSTQSEIRKKNSIIDLISNSYDLVSRETFSYKVNSRRLSINAEISVSEDGVVKFVDLVTKDQFNFTDIQTTIPVKFITFGGYRNYPATYEIDCLKAENKC